MPVNWHIIKKNICIRSLVLYGHLFDLVFCSFTVLEDRFQVWFLLFYLFDFVLFCTAWDCVRLPKVAVDDFNYCWKF